MINSVNLQTAYPKYKMLLSNSAKKISKELGTKVIIEPTSKKICQKVGLNKEVANCLNTADFLKMVYQKIKEKGYRIPKIFISEEQSPREYNIAGQQLGNWNIYGPGRLEVSEPSLIIHECAHFLHNKNMPWNQPLYAIFCSSKILRYLSYLSLLSNPLSTARFTLQSGSLVCVHGWNLQPSASETYSS